MFPWTWPLIIFLTGSVGPVYAAAKPLAGSSGITVVVEQSRGESIHKHIITTFLVEQRKFFWEFWCLPDRWNWADSQRDLSAEYDDGGRAEGE